LRENGVRIDTTFVGGHFFRGTYLNGSGLPVKLMDEQGELIDLYEQCTNLSEDQYFSNKIMAPTLTIDECIKFTRKHLDDAVDHYHSVYNPCFHPRRTRPGGESTQRWYEDALEYCIDRGFHFTNASDWLDFNDGRASLRLSRYIFDPGTLTLKFGLEAMLDVKGLGLIFPFTFRGRVMSSADIDGQPVAIGDQMIEGRRQVILPADYVAGETRTWRISWNTE